MPRKMIAPPLQQSGPAQCESIIGERWTFSGIRPQYCGAFLHVEVVDNTTSLPYAKLVLVKCRVDHLISGEGVLPEEQPPQDARGDDEDEPQVLGGTW